MISHTERERTMKLGFKDVCQPENRSLKNWKYKFMNYNRKTQTSEK